MGHTSVYGLLNEVAGGVDGDVFPASEYNLLADTIEAALVILAELFGQSGPLATSDFNGALGELSGGYAICGAAGSRHLVHNAAHVAISSLTGGVLNYVWLLPDGTAQANTSGVPPSGGVLCCTRASGGTYDNAPVGRVNLLGAFAGMVEAGDLPGYLADKLVEGSGVALEVLTDAVTGAKTLAIRSTGGDGGLLTTEITRYWDLDLQVGVPVELVWDHSAQAQFGHVVMSFAQAQEEGGGDPLAGVRITPLLQASDGTPDDESHMVMLVEAVTP